MRIVPLAALTALCVLPLAPARADGGKSQEVGAKKIAFEGGTDLSKLTLGATTFGLPVRAVDLHGKVVAIRTWSG